MEQKAGLAMEEGNKRAEGTERTRSSARQVIRIKAFMSKPLQVCMKHRQHMRYRRRRQILFKNVFNSSSGRQQQEEPSNKCRQAKPIRVRNEEPNKSNMNARRYNEKRIQAARLPHRLSAHSLLPLL
jgi:hypothetical protein